jgi:ABC-type spermidine/putrescine transport system permease subunit I
MAVGVKNAVNRLLNGWTVLVLLPLLFLTFFFALPIYEISVRSVTDPTIGLENYVEFFSSSVYLRVLFSTMQISLMVTAVCLLLGYPYAYLMSQTRGRFADLMLLALLIPFWSSLLVRTYAWLVILQESGLINSTLLSLGIVDQPLPLVRNFLGVVIGMVHVLLPFMVLPLYAVMKKIDRNYMRAASNLGASPMQAFGRIFLPLSMPGVYAGALLVFVIALGFYVTPALLGSPRQAMLGEIVVTQVQQLSNWGLGSAMALVLLAVTLVVLAIASRVVRISDAFGGGQNL